VLRWILFGWLSKASHQDAPSEEELRRTSMALDEEYSNIGVIAFLRLLLQQRFQF